MKAEVKKTPIESGDVFGELTVIARDHEAEEKRKNQGKQRRQMFLCRCSCGVEKVIMASSLTRADHPVLSCGHLRGHKRQKLTEDTERNLTGRTFGKLTVLHLDEAVAPGGGIHWKWICKCECGTTKSIRSSDLRNGSALDCGCGKRKRLSDAAIHDLTGQTFGHLHVLRRGNGIAKNGGIHAKWECRCDICGQTEIVQGPMLERYGKDRCLACCGKSLGETKIKELLDGAGITYVHDMPYEDCRSDDKDGFLRFDFRATDPKTGQIYMIEFDGEHHFKEVPTWYCAGGLHSVLQRDEAKNRWCAEHDVPMIRIPYTRLKDMCLEDILLESSKYIIGEQHETHIE